VFVPFKKKPFFELDTNPTSEETESLRKTRIKKDGNYISKLKFAGE